MQGETEEPVKKLADHLFTLPIEDYLWSENFALFCRQNDIEDIWKEYLDLSRARPDIYGKFVIKNTLILFLHHIFHSRPDEFVDVFTRFPSRYSHEINVPLPLDDLKADLLDLGYSHDNLDTPFSVLKAEEAVHRKCGIISNPD
jgi:hypothetical protein